MSVLLPLTYLGQDSSTSETPTLKAEYSNNNYNYKSYDNNYQPQNNNYKANENAPPIAATFKQIVMPSRASANNNYQPKNNNYNTHDGSPRKPPDNADHVGLAVLPIAATMKPMPSRSAANR